MIDPKELRIGNIVDTINSANKVHLPNSFAMRVFDITPFDVSLYPIGENPANVKEMPDFKITDLYPITLTEDWLFRFGFKSIKAASYINSKKWLMQVSDDYIEKGNIINRDGTWFDAIGRIRFKENGEMAVNTLCRGNYICASCRTVHQLQNLYFALTGKELELKPEL